MSHLTVYRIDQAVQGHRVQDIREGSRQDCEPCTEGPGLRSQWWFLQVKSAELADSATVPFFIILASVCITLMYSICRMRGTLSSMG